MSGEGLLETVATTSKGLLFLDGVERENIQLEIKSQ